ncbi:MAG TPA: 4a-hydroxytetrahydrobiopterin dehydratase [Candidatus Paceibacterota bacterium]|jgi:4a-hydroxytetrahydrobiopterin dehydratase|nr:4a-hydroxytetrahydrobiopterin dehydratase [Candidatus Paceibacterota bacterium]
MTELAQKKCVACEGNVAPFNRTEAEILMKQLKNWTLSGDDRWISKEFKFKDFKEALAFVDKVGAIAEEEGHHPDIQLSWGKAVIELTTHAIKGLSENDMIVAAKIDRIA